jgi:hypothetical protein
MQKVRFLPFRTLNHTDPETYSLLIVSHHPRKFTLHSRRIPLLQFIPGLILSRRILYLHPKPSQTPLCTITIHFI